MIPLARLYKTILITAVFISTNAYAQTVKIATGEWAPFISESLANQGLVAAIIDESFKTQQLQTQYGFYPWKRAMDLASKGSWHATTPWAMSEERKTDFYYSLPIIEESNVLLHHKDLDLTWSNFEDLSQYKIGITKGYSYGDEFTAAEANKILRVQRTSTDRQNLKKLVAGRIDIFIVEKNVAKSLIKNELKPEVANNYIFNEKPLSTRGLHLLFSKASPTAKVMLNAFNTGLTTIKDNGIYSKLTDND